MACIDSPQLLTQKQELLQLMEDVLRVSRHEESPINLILSQYKALRCAVTPVEKYSPEHTRVLELLQQGCDGYEPSGIMSLAGDVPIADVILVHGMWRIRRGDEAARFVGGGVGNQCFLFHGSKTGNWLGIVSRGFLDPKYVKQCLGVNRTDEGFLGNGIYFTPDPRTAAKYTSPGKRGTRFIAMSTVALGSVKEYPMLQVGLDSPPPGYHSCKSRKSTATQKSDFEDEEYVIFNPDQQRLEYLIEFLLPTDVLVTEPTQQKNAEHSPTKKRRTAPPPLPPPPPPRLKPVAATSKQPLENLAERSVIEPQFTEPEFRTIQHTPDVNKLHRQTSTSAEPETNYSWGLSNSNAKSIVEASKVAVEMLTPAMTGSRWFVDMLVTWRSGLMTWERQGKSGVFFYVDLIDEKGDRIRATGFGLAAKKFHPLLREGAAYAIAGAVIQPARQTFGVMKCPYQLLLTESSVVEPSSEPTFVFPRIVPHYMLLLSALKMPHQSVVDVVGYIDNLGPLEAIKAASTGNMIPMRVITLRDKSGIASLSVWYNIAKDDLVRKGSVIAVTGALVNDFQGKKTLSIKHASFHIFHDDETIPEVMRLKRWIEGTSSQGMQELEETATEDRETVLPFQAPRIPQLPSAESARRPYSTWDTEVTAQWISEQVGLPQYADVFRRQCVGGAVLATLTDRALVSLLGVTSREHRQAIIDGIARLEEESHVRYQQWLRTIMRTQDEVDEFAREVAVRVRSHGARFDWDGFGAFLRGVCDEALARNILSRMHPTALARV
eukprot:TRINITY_DN374_c0_g1_i1.p1 TRINITY_DN374_c0_g1~~TRINITY_DN374_c0_g1_i1.p1  ORF type:complete len:777 (+),score=167.96 TRINITY_DN374_c0_g1_i1:1339-3669(+)